MTHGRVTTPMTAGRGASSPPQSAPPGGKLKGCAVPSGDPARFAFGSPPFGPIERSLVARYVRFVDEQARFAATISKERISDWPEWAATEEGSK